MEALHSRGRPGPESIEERWPEEEEASFHLERHGLCIDSLSTFCAFGWQKRGLVCKESAWPFLS